MKNVSLSDASRMYLELMLKDEKIHSIFADERDGGKFSKVTIECNGDITLGKTNAGWLNKWFGDTKKIDFATIALRIIDVLSGAGNARNKTVLDGLSKELVQSTISEEGSRNRFIDALFMTYKFTFTENVDNYIDTPKSKTNDDDDDYRRKKKNTGIDEKSSFLCINVNGVLKGIKLSDVDNITITQD